MSNPDVKVTISATDGASPVLKQMEESAKRAGAAASGVLKGGADSLTPALRNANSAAKQYEATLDRIKGIRNAIAGLVTGYVGLKLTAEAKALLDKYGPYEAKVRAQTVFGNYSTEGQRLLKERRAAGTNYGKTPQEVEEGQDVFVRRNMKADIVKAMTDAAIELSKTLGVAVDQAARIIEKQVFTLGPEPTTAAEAKQKATEASNRVAVAVKKGAMDPNEVEQAGIYGNPAIRASGMDANYGWAEIATLSRAGESGEKAGVFVRAQAASTLAMTSKGRDAARAAGINPDDYWRGKPVSMEGKDLSLINRDRYGKTWTKDQIKAYDNYTSQLQKDLQSDDEEVAKNAADVLNSRGAFIEGVMEVIDPKGEMSKTDALHVSSTIGRQFDMRRENFDTTRFTRDFMKKSNSQQRIGMYGPKQGNRANILAAAQDQVEHYEEEYRKGQEENLSHNIAEERNKGAGAALERLHAKKEQAILSTGDDLAPAIEGGADWLSGALDWYNKQNGYVKGAAVVGGAAGSTAITAGTSALTWWGVKKVVSKVVGNGAKAAATAVTEGATEAAAAAAAEGGVLSTVGRWAGKGARGAFSAGSLGVAAGLTAAELYYQNHPEGTQAEADMNSLTAEYSRVRRGNRRFGKPKEQPLPDFATLDLPDTSTHWYDGAGWQPINPDKVQWPNPAQTSAAQGQPAGIDVHGTVEGQASINVNVVVTPSPLFDAKMDGLKNDVVRLSGRLGGDKTGTNLSGSNGVSPSTAGVAP